MNNPFDLASYVPQVSMRDQEKVRRSAYQMSRYVNEQRKKGIEPSAPYSERTDLNLGSEPQEMVVEMPAMALHKKTLQARKRKQQ
jgi:predicted HicB family RNase H-like nuclease